MSEFRFQKRKWESFVYQGQTFALDHLDEYLLTVLDSKKTPRSIIVTFTDHCFTRNGRDSDSRALIYPQSERCPGYFCLDRYHHSLRLRDHLHQAASKIVWNVEGANFAAIPTVDHLGKRMLYGIVFSLDRVKKMPGVDLHMRVRSAYPCDERDLVTFGNVRFSHLVSLKMDNSKPSKVFGAHRKHPRLGD